MKERRGELRGTDSEGYAAPALLSSPVPIVDEKETKHMQGPQCSNNERSTSSEKVYQRKDQRSIDPTMRAKEQLRIPDGGGLSFRTPQP